MCGSVDETQLQMKIGVRVKYEELVVFGAQGRV